MSLIYLCPMESVLVAQNDNRSPNKDSFEQTASSFHLPPFDESAEGNGTIVITGFGPYGRLAGNLSADVAKSLDGKILASGYKVEGFELPACHSKAAEAIKTMLLLKRPKALVLFGITSSVRGPTLENEAYNIQDGQDECGEHPHRAPIIRGGPATYRTQINLEYLVQIMKQAGITSKVSNDMEKDYFVCNSTYYNALRIVAKHHLPTQVLFVHIPDPWDHNFDDLCLEDHWGNCPSEIKKWSRDFIDIFARVSLKNSTVDP